MDQTNLESNIDHSNLQPLSNNTTNPSTPTFSPKSKKISIIAVILLLLFIVFLTYFGFKIFGNVVPEKKNNDIPRIQNNISENIESLQRAKSDIDVKNETYVLFSGITKKVNDTYEGSFETGTSFPYNEKFIEEDREFTKRVSEDSEAQQSLFVFEARDINDNLLLKMPVSATVGIDIDIPISSYTEPGFFSLYALLPVHTNSVVLRVRNELLLDRVYVEDWKPTINFKAVPGQVNSTDVLTIKGDLLPQNKAFIYSIDIVDINGNKNIPLVVTTQATSGEFSHEVKLANYPEIKSGQMKLRATASTAFQTFGPFESETFLLQDSTDGIKVEIAPKTKSRYKANDTENFNWSHLFYGVDVFRGLEDLCSQQKICYELTWSGDGINFTDVDPAYLKGSCEKDKCTITSAGNEQYFQNKVTTKKRYINCIFNGSGEQTLNLTVSKDGIIIGKDSLTYVVDGSGDGSTLCKVPVYSIDY